jgi:HAE1 family hydrophobic/amphiphilic exporter-1
VVLVSCGGLSYLGTFIEHEFIPELHQGEFTVDVTLPTGTPLDTTAQTVEHLERLALQQPYVTRSSSSIGRRQHSGTAIDAEPENLAQLRLTLSPHVRARDADTLQGALRQTFQTLPGVQVQFARPAYFSFKTPLEVDIRGHNLDTLRDTARRVFERLAGLPGLVDLHSSTAQGETELQILFDRQKVAALGLDMADIANIVRQNVPGEVTTTFMRPERGIDIRIRAHAALRQSIAAVECLQVHPHSATPVPLSAVATLFVVHRPDEIRHADLQRVAVVSAHVQGPALGEMVRELRRTLAQVALPAGFVALVRGQSTEMTDAVRGLVLALGLATLLVYLVLAAHFASFVQPLLIMVAIPLGLSGGILALWLSGGRINVMVCIAAVLLPGMVVHSAMILIDSGNQCRRRGLKRQQAIQEAATAHFRPTMMTTTTAVLGLLPMIFGSGQGVEWCAPLAITVTGGHLVATLLMLLVIPVAYRSIHLKRDTPWHQSLSAMA